jgi:hypothetical protein
VDARPTKGFTLSRQSPFFGSAKFTVIVIGGALCLATPALTTAVISSSVSAAPSHTVVRAAAARLAATTSHTARTAGVADLQATTMAAVQRVRFGIGARVEAIKAEEAAAARARALAAREHAAHVAHQEHLTLLAGAAKAAAQQQTVQQQPSQQPTQQPVSVPSGSPQQIAEGMLGQFGWSGGQFSCLVSLWNAESGWNPTAENPNSGAYGIPQALPGSKMASAGPDWQTNPATQILWGLRYIQSTYGSPCAAWSHEEATGWY